MKRRSLFSMIAAGLACAFMFAASAQAATIIVHDDSGGGTVDVLGTAAGADVNNFHSAITEINGSVVSIPLNLDTLHLFDSGGVITGTGTKTIGVMGNEAVLTFAITSGTVMPHFVNLEGMITGVTPPGTVTSGGNTYDFSQMFPGGVINITFTKTVNTDYTTVFNHPGHNALTSGLGLQQAVPEPTSMALLGIGMTGFLAFRRLCKRTSVA